MDELPVSLRTDKGESTYAQAKKDKLLKSFSDEKLIHSFKYWGVIENRFPYDACYSLHHMLIPLRVVRTRFDLNDAERTELERILEYFVEPNYDVLFDNMDSMRSVLTHYHLHIAKYHTARSKMAFR